MSKYLGIAGKTAHVNDGYVAGVQRSTFCFERVVDLISSGETTSAYKWP